MGSEVFLPSSKQSLEYEALAAALVFSSLLFANLRAFLTGSRSFGSLNLATIAFAVLPVLVYGALFVLRAEGLWRVSTGGLMGVYTALVAANCITLLAVIAVRFPSQWDWRLLPFERGRTMAREASRAYVANVLQFLSYRIDYWLVEFFSGLRALGLYSLASSLAQTAWLVPRSASTVFLPVLASGDRRDFGRQALIVRLTLVVFVPLAILATFGSSALLGVVYGPEFSGAATAFSVLLIGCVPYTASIVLASGLAAHGHQILNLRASLWGFLVTVVCDLILIPRFGMMGAAVASSLSYLVTTVYVARRFANLFSIPLVTLFLPQRGDWAAVQAARRALFSRG
jgi:O-antigen/teichoic acid export membrane protein